MQDAMIRATVTAVAERLNTTVESIVIHCDESAPHAHFTLRAVTHEGTPVSKIVDRTVTSELQDALFRTIVPYLPAIERGSRKIDRIAAGANPSETINRTVRQLHLDLPIERDTLLAANAELCDENEALAAANRDLSYKADCQQRELADIGKRIEIARAEAYAVERRVVTAKADVQRCQKAFEAMQTEAQSEREALVRDRERVHNFAREHDSLRLGIEMCIEGTLRVALEADGRVRIVWDSNRNNQAQRVAIKPMIAPGLRLLRPLLASVCQIPVGGMLGHGGEHDGTGFRPGHR